MVDEVVIEQYRVALLLHVVAVHAPRHLLVLQQVDVALDGAECADEVVGDAAPRSRPC